MTSAAIIIHTKWQLKQVKELLDQMQPPRLNWALRNAVNDTAKQLERQAERDVAKATSIPGRRVKARIYIRPMATADLLEATVHGSKSPIPLKIFKAKETPIGVTVRIWGKKQLLPNAFIRGGKFPDRKDLGMDGHIFARISKNRSPIHKGSGATIAEAMVQQVISNALVKLSQEHMLVNLKRQFDRYSRSRSARH
ncbi:MAG: hypothetical protein JSC189_000466 [Candidatus Tokpelaia sp. JSC189]|nr:MAG: hypothetical protein JSC189_000466 [Candidatus Tokpelaia sp. JSC189]